VKLVLEESDYRLVFDMVQSGDREQDNVFQYLPDEVYVNIAGHLLLELRDAVPDRATWRLSEQVEGPA
jgi:hypothetical protein